MFVCAVTRQNLKLYLWKVLIDVKGSNLRV